MVFFGAWRVNGSLSVSRAIGDAEHKPYVSGEPDTEEFDLEGNIHVYLIIGYYYKNKAVFNELSW